MTIFTASAVTCSYPSSSPAVSKTASLRKHVCHTIRPGACARCARYRKPSLEDSIPKNRLPQTRFGGPETRFAGRETRFGGPETRFAVSQTKFRAWQTKSGARQTKSGIDRTRFQRSKTKTKGQQPALPATKKGQTKKHCRTAQSHDIL